MGRPRFEKLADDAKTRVKEVSASTAAALTRGGARLFDVREQEDFVKGHAKGACHLSKGIIEMRIEQEVPDPATAIVLYCGGGNRSALAADNLQKMGYTGVASLTGGFEAWQAAGLPIE
jgi:phage shock protein E